MSRAILLVSCPDQKGLVARLSDFIFRHDGNIVAADHHTDFESGLFLTRLEWDLEGFALERGELDAKLGELAGELQARWELEVSDRKARVAVFVTKQDHCLLDLLWRQRAGELPATIPLVISNHPNLQATAEQFEVDYHHVPITQETKPEQERKQLALLRDYDIDLVVLAKYMQILSGEFVEGFSKIINIHHSFLPAFAGSKPYHRAYERGVKIIGATAHYVTAGLDEGPIIEQDVIRVSHRDSVRALVRKGKDLERLVLARAVRHHLEHRVLVYRNRTVVFA
ncbi:MAG: formyltetrahydrofolate deformylase [Deltaproteobacteria bacterium]|jgi:formyltetrahydrofolate deformylase|nr:formyltetrahydrofolate deformylase [Deltaproteobacteria bacterium]MBW2530336.1 formyltetrahydrofolate deformylase [Deltaproteobacteria bacterium]